MNNKEKDVKPEDVLEQFVMTDAVSSTECTGLLPTPPKNDAERASYNRIYNYLPPEPEIKKD